MKCIKPGVFSFILIHSIAFAQNENIDQAVMSRIRKEGLENSKVMDIAFHVTDASGPRLTGSPGFMRAATYAKEQLSQWGLTNSMLDPWGGFGKGWELQKSYVAMTSPWYKSLEAYPKAWTGGTNGLHNAGVMLITAKDSAGLDAYRGKLAGKILILERNDSYKLSFKPDASRYTDEELNSMENNIIQPSDTTAMRIRREQFINENRILNTLKSIATGEGAVAVFTTSPRNHDGTIFVQQAGPFKVSDPANFLDIALQWEDYMSIVRLLKNNIA